MGLFEVGAKVSETSSKKFQARIQASPDDCWKDFRRSAIAFNASGGAWAIERRMKLLMESGTFRRSRSQALIVTTETPSIKASSDWERSFLILNAVNSNPVI